jgi:DNA-binding LacI/PurR family transcriptional regulator
MDTLTTEYTLQNHPKIPKYWKIAEELRARMRSGELAPGARLPSVVEMRARYGISLTTVDRAYSMLAKEGLIVCIQGNGTFVADPQQRLKTGVIGVHLHLGAEQHPFYTHLWRGIREVADRAQRELLVLHHQAPKSWEKMDGILLTQDRSPEVQWQVPLLMPRVSLLNPIPDTPSITVDDYDGMAQIVEHLLELGHRRIALLSLARPDHPYLPLQHRYAGYADTLASADVTLAASWVRPLRREGDKLFSFPALGYEKMRAWLQNGWAQIGCTAIIAHNDDVALGILKALREAGLRVPEDVSVVGFDGTEIAEYSNPTLTTVEVPLERVGALGMELLLTRLDAPSETIPPTQVLPLHLKPGQSTAPPRRA